MVPDFSPSTQTNVKTPRLRFKITLYVAPCHPSFIVAFFEARRPPPHFSSHPILAFRPKSFDKTTRDRAEFRGWLCRLYCVGVWLENRVMLQENRLCNDKEEEGWKGLNFLAREPEQRWGRGVQKKKEMKIRFWHSALTADRGKRKHRHIHEQRFENGNTADKDCSRLSNE